MANKKEKNLRLLFIGNSHPMAPEEKYRTAAGKLCEWIRQAGATPVIYATWEKKDEPEKQEEMDKLNRAVVPALFAVLFFGQPDMVFFRYQGRY